MSIAKNYFRNCEALETYINNLSIEDFKDKHMEGYGPLHEACRFRM